MYKLTLLILLKIKQVRKVKTKPLRKAHQPNQQSHTHIISHQPKQQSHHNQQIQTEKEGNGYDNKYGLNNHRILFPNLVYIKRTL